MTGQTPCGQTATATSRKRAAQACLACRARKVRCDVTARGPPCMHCRLDHADCVVRGRPSKYRKIRANSPSGHFNFAVEETYKPRQRTESKGFAATVENKLPRADSIPEQHEAKNFEDCSEPSTEELNKDSPHHREKQGPSFAAQSFPSDPDLNGASSARYVEPTVPDERPVEIDCEEHTSSTTHVLYSYYPFLGLDTLPFMPPEDVNYLESQGCFRVPVRPFLDEFLQQYFLHVHPALPIIDEGSFWDLYSSKAFTLPSEPPIPLFVLQSIIFASCCYVSTTTIHGLGFSDGLSARATYYRRAKLLFDFEGDKDPIAAAQGALLLSYHPPMPNHNKINSFWVGLAIQYAKNAGAHRYHTNTLLLSTEKNVLKRLWWCCILRDRIISLGVRRPLQISSLDFDFTQPSLHSTDLESEVGRSRVYDAPTKHALVHLVNALCELAVILTDVLMLVYPLHDSIDMAFQSEEKANQSLDRLLPSRSALAAWYRKISMSFPASAGRGDMNDSVILYANIIYIYYHSAILALSQHEILLSAMKPSSQGQPWHRICRSKTNLEEAASGITDILKTLYELGLTRYLPISVVAYAAFPLVLHILDVKLATTQPNRARKQKRLKVYTDTMKILQAQYDGTNELTDIIARMIRYVSVEQPAQQPQLILANEDILMKNVGGHSMPSSGPSPNPTLQSLKTVNDWGHVLLRQPNLYLRFAMTIDLALEKGHFPNDCDFPVALQWRNTTTTRFPMYRITMSSVDSVDDPSSNGERAGRQACHGGVVNELPTRKDSINTSTLRTTAASLPTKYEFQTQTQTQQVNFDGRNLFNDNLELQLDYGSVEQSQAGISDMEFNYASAWPEEIFITTE